MAALTKCSDTFDLVDPWTCHKAPLSLKIAPQRLNHLSLDSIKIIPDCFKRGSSRFTRLTRVGGTNAETETKERLWGKGCFCQTLLFLFIVLFAPFFDLMHSSSSPPFFIPLFGHDGGWVVSCEWKVCVVVCVCLCFRERASVCVTARETEC